MIEFFCKNFQFILDIGKGPNAFKPADVSLQNSSVKIDQDVRVSQMY